MTATFGAITIAERGSGTTFPVWDYPSEIVIKHIPPSGNVIQVVTSGAPRMAYVAKVSAASLALLYAAKGTTADLVFSYETASAYLESITGGAEQLAGKDVYFVTLNFIRRGGSGPGTAPANAILSESGDPLLSESGNYMVGE